MFYIVGKRAQLSADFHQGGVLKSLFNRCYLNANIKISNKSYNLKYKWDYLSGCCISCKSLNYMDFPEIINALNVQVHGY